MPIELNNVLNKVYGKARPDQVRYTRGVNQIVRFGDLLLSVSKGVIERIKHLEGGLNRSMQHSIL